MGHGRRIKIVLPLWIVVFIVAALPIIVHATVPMLINYQGYLTDDSGTPLSGKQSVNFRLYSLETGGFFFWQEEQLVVITGVSGSGKSTLAFDLLFAEGQRRFLDSMNTSPDISISG